LLSPRFGRSAALVLSIVAALVLAGCSLEGPILDGPIAVNLHVHSTDTTIEVDAPGWFAERSRVYVCHTDPPLLPDPGPERIGWEPGDACHAYGLIEGDGGLVASLPIADLLGEQGADFAAAEAWYLLMLEVDPEDRVLGAVRSRFDVPDAIRAS
jgi:hypothetical protein